MAGAAPAAPLAPGDLLMSCAYWGITRIEATTGEQHPIGIDNGGGYSTLAEDAQGLVWTIDNCWVVSIDPATGEHDLIAQLPNDFDGSNDGELLPEPEGTLLHAGDGEISRIDPGSSASIACASSRTAICSCCAARRGVRCASIPTTARRVSTRTRSARSLRLRSRRTAT
ncbi:MAG: hypothetical protein DCC71_11895 [Proteobacteria bacterium]|nr:MAG: hypothetical protein DCC71_11895 [Pseudomonadota bacterium]